MALILDGNGLIQGLDAGGLPSGSVNADSLASTLDLSSKTMTFSNVSASGITFPATQSASGNANTLDDYEEGTFTPTLEGSTTAGTTTYSEQYGIYTKIGSQVSVSIFLNVSAATGTGQMQIGGLPFTPITGYQGTAPCMPHGYNWGSGTYLVAFVAGGDSYFRIYSCADDAAWSAQSIVNEAQRFMITATYFV